MTFSPPGSPGNGDRGDVRLETSLSLRAWCQFLVNADVPEGQQPHDYRPLALKYLAGTIAPAELADLILRHVRAREGSFFYY